MLGYLLGHLLEHRNSVTESHDREDMGLNLVEDMLTMAPALISFSPVPTRSVALSTLPNLPLLLTSKMAAIALNQNNAPVLQASFNLNL